MQYPSVLEHLIRELGRLPGIGPKSAQRLAFHIINLDHGDNQALIDALIAAQDGLTRCPECGNIMDKDAQKCTICSDQRRDQTIICVVEQPADVIAIERSGEYRGLYHVLHGALSPMNGIGPAQLGIERIGERLTGVQELLLATSTTVEGEATAMFIRRQFEERVERFSRIAYGLPVGGDLEYADEVTLGRAIHNRQSL